MNARRTHGGAHALRAFLLVLAGFALTATFATPASATVTPTASLAQARSGHVAVALPTADGVVRRVLVTGGTATGAPAGAIATTEIYDVASGTWAAGPALPVAETNAYAVPIPINAVYPQGGVFLIGGALAAGGIDIVPRIYNAATNGWTSVTGTNFQMSPSRTELTVSVSGNRIALVGGITLQGVPSQTVELFDTLTGARVTNPTVAPLLAARRSHAATVLADGRILVSGGYATASGTAPALATAEIINPAAPATTAFATAPLPEPRAQHTASLVDGTRALLTGGVPAQGGQALASSQTYDPAANAWAASGSMSVARVGQQGTVVRPNWLAITGGTNAASPGGIDTAESWTPLSGWGGLYGLTAPESIGSPRAAHTATALPQSDQVLIVGGGTPPTASAVRYTPDLPPTAPAPPTESATPPAPLVFQEGPIPVPVQGKTVTAAVVSGTVYVRIGKTDEYRPLKVGEPVPVGTVLDTTDGRIRLTAAVGITRQSADFYGGTFEVRQPKGEAGLVELRLIGKPTCAKKKATAAVKRKGKPRLWGDGKGKFRTRGSNSSASVRGTKWLVEERCTGTYTKVDRGAVNVRDFGKHKTVLVKSPKSYLAKPPKR